MEAFIDYTALIIYPEPFREYDLSFGISLSKVGRDGSKVSMCERKVSNLIYYFLVISF